MLKCGLPFFSGIHEMCFIYFRETTDSAILTELQAEVCQFDSASCTGGFSLKRAAIVSVQGSMAFDVRDYVSILVLLLS